MTSPETKRWPNGHRLKSCSKVTTWPVRIEIINIKACLRLVQTARNVMLTVQGLNFLREEGQMLFAERDITKDQNETIEELVPEGHLFRDVTKQVF